MSWSLWILSLGLSCSWVLGEEEPLPREEQLALCLEEDPGDTECLGEMGLYQRDRGARYQALWYLSAAAELDPERWRAEARALERDLEESPGTPRAARKRSWSVLEDRLELRSGRPWRYLELKATLNSGAESTGSLWLYLPQEMNLPGRQPFPLLLGLPGWRYAGISWDDEARLGEYADDYEVALALLDMGSSVYESAYYDETEADYRWSPEGSIPGLTWVSQVILPFLEEQGMSPETVLGFSTGAQGAVMLAQAHPDRIQRVCGMSGTFDLFSLRQGGGEYRIHEVIYGAREEFEERWARDDPQRNLDKLEAEVLLIHGSRDSTVPAKQSREFAKQAKQQGLSVEYSQIKGGGHDWDFWIEHLPQCMDFLHPQSSVEAASDQIEGSSQEQDAAMD